MSAPIAVEINPPNMAYIWNKKKIYADAIKKLTKADMIFVVPINYIDKVDSTKNVPSLIYMSTWDSVFIFDLIMLKEKGITKELLAIIESGKKKFVYSKQITFTLLGLDNWGHIPNVFDIEPSGEQFSPYGNGNVGGEDEASASSTEFRIDEVDWRVRPFKANEQFKAGNRVYEVTMKFTDYKP
ncbi:uncharacterized protein [Onthophagus taurus]|uniref:uncharacterized protein n=1 Tax=Onthophagus taurus TaxID=166361 RepID=UPI0039BE2AEB